MATTRNTLPKASSSMSRGALVSTLLLSALLASGVVALLIRSWGLTGLAVGVLFGFAMQRAAFCGSALISSVVLLKDVRGLIGVLIAVGVSMVGFGALAALGWIRPNPKPFFLLPALVGGVVFGSGMVLAGGCVSGSLFKAAEGRLNSILAVVGVGLGTTMGVLGLLAPARRWLRESTSGLVIAPSLDQALGVSYAALALPMGGVCVLTGWWLWRRANPLRRGDAAEGTPSKPWLRRGWSVAMAGAVLGAVGWLAYAASAAAGRNYPLGCTKSVLQAFSALTGGHLPILGWMLWLGLGVVLGSAISAWQRGELRLRSADPATLLVALGGGVLTGLGAAVGMGCFIGHMLSGWALLSFHSLVFGVVAVLANWLTTILYLRGWK